MLRRSLKGVKTPFSVRADRVSASAPNSLLRKHVWSAARRQEESGVTRTVCENVSGLLVENDLRALDDDAHVPVLFNPHGLNDLVSPQVFRHAV